MSSHRQRKSGAWEYQYERKGLLERTYVLYDSEEEGDIMSARIEMLLDKGVVPVELLSSKLATLSDVITTYSKNETLAHSSATLVPILDKLVGHVSTSTVSTEWADSWIEMMKQKMAPSTVKKRVELLARALDWAIRKKLVTLVVNPLRTLPRGYAGKVSRHDTWAGQRGRRLSADGLEEGAIRKVLKSKEEHLFFDMALESAMRMREMYTLTRDQVNFDKNTIFLEKTKNGSKRQVPMTTVSKRLLAEHLATLEGDALFPWWKGETDEFALDVISINLSQRFAKRFAKAGCPDLHFHDLRHEAISRIFERTTLSDLSIAAISGHSDSRMLARYANLRGSNLAVHLW